MADSESFTKTQIITGVVVGIILVGVVILFVYLQQNTSSPLFRDDSCRLNESGMLIDPCVPLIKVIITTGKSESKKSPVSFWSEDNRQWEKKIEEWVTEHCVFYVPDPHDSPDPEYGFLSKCPVHFGESESLNGSIRLEIVGMQEIIPASEAIERLNYDKGLFHPPTKGSVYNHLPHVAMNLSIVSMNLEYLMTSDHQNHTYLEPVWDITAREEIRDMPFRFYIPADYQPSKQRTFQKNEFSHFFSNISFFSTVPDLALPYHFWVGSSGPVGNVTAAEEVRLFLENPGSNLTYKGRYQQISGPCGGYQYEYYRFEKDDCQILVDVYSGSVVRAVINESCIRPGFSGKSVMGNISKAEAKTLTDKFVREKYRLFNENHLIADSFDYTYNEGGENQISFSGDFAGIRQSGVNIRIRFYDGLITRYEVADDSLEYMCSSGGYVKINE